MEAFAQWIERIPRPETPIATMLQRAFFTLLPAALVAAFPQQTGSANITAAPSATTTTSSDPASMITTAPGLTCTGGSTVLFTQDCTFGNPVSYCYSPPPPISCGEGYFPSVWHPGHCITESTCYPTDASWITTECSNGQVPYSTTTLYGGTLADGQSTTISEVYCSCHSDEWYSATIIGSNVENFCMPHTSCPDGMTTSTSTNTYCVTAPPESCSGIATYADFCQCWPSSTPVYPADAGTTPTGCAALS